MRPSPLLLFGFSLCGAHCFELASQVASLAVLIQTIGSAIHEFVLAIAFRSKNLHVLFQSIATGECPRTSLFFGIHYCVKTESRCYCYDSVFVRL